MDHRFLGEKIQALCFPFLIAEKCSISLYRQRPLHHSFDYDARKLNFLYFPNSRYEVEKQEIKWMAKIRRKRNDTLMNKERALQFTADVDSYTKPLQTLSLSVSRD